MGKDNLRAFAYTVWFKDICLEPDEQEWVAVFVVEAESAEAALSWGDYLAHSYSIRNPEEAVFLSSDITALDDPKWSRGRAPWAKPVTWVDTPHVKYGHMATDDEIGW